MSRKLVGYAAMLGKSICVFVAFKLVLILLLHFMPAHDFWIEKLVAVLMVLVWVPFCLMPFYRGVIEKRD